MSYDGRIALLPGQGTAEEFSTLVHELAHEMLHKAERRTATTKTVRETEAEAIAFVIGTAIGLQTGRASADYIHLYHGNAALLAESLEVVQRTAAVILSALEPQPPRPKATPARHWRKPATPLDRDGVTVHSRTPSSQLCRCTERRRSTASVRKKSNDKTGAAYARVDEGLRLNSSARHSSSRSTARPCGTDACPRRKTAPPSGQAGREMEAATRGFGSRRRRCQASQAVGRRASGLAI